MKKRNFRLQSFLDMNFCSRNPTDQYTVKNKSDVLFALIHMYVLSAVK